MLSVCVSVTSEGKLHDFLIKLNQMFDCYRVRYFG